MTHLFIDSGFQSLGKVNLSLFSSHHFSNFCVLIPFFSSFRESDCPGIEQANSWRGRGTNGGPLLTPELLDSAESSNGDLLNTHFQLDQPRPSKYGSQESHGTMRTPSRSETPKTDKLSSGRNNGQRKRGSGSEYGDDGGNGATAVTVTVISLMSHYGISVSLTTFCVLFSWSRSVIIRA